MIPLFLLRFSRKAKPLAGALGIWLMIWIAISVANNGVFYGLSLALFHLVTALIAASFVLPYVVDRLIASRLPGFITTLVFPSA